MFLIRYFVVCLSVSLSVCLFVCLFVCLQVAGEDRHQLFTGQHTPANILPFTSQGLVQGITGEYRVVIIMLPYVSKNLEHKRPAK